MCSLVSPSYQPFLFRAFISFYFFPPLFSWQPSFRNVEANFHRLFLPSFSHFSIANFKHCWVIPPPPLFPDFHPFRTPITRRPFPSPKSLLEVPPLILPSSRPLSTSTKFFVHFRPACTVNFFLFRSCLEVLFLSPLNVPLRSLNIIIKRLRNCPLSRQKCTVIFTSVSTKIWIENRESQLFHC